jgi:hypothetical protein
VEGFGDFNIGGNIISSVKYADDLELPAKTVTLIQGLINTLIEPGRCCRMEKNEDKTKVIRISRHVSPI